MVALNATQFLHEEDMGKWESGDGKVGKRPSLTVQGAYRSME